MEQKVGSKKLIFFLRNEPAIQVTNEAKWLAHTDLTNATDISARGGGYWFWKPVLILEHLLTLNENDFIFYTDADWLLGNVSVNWIQLMVEHGSDFALIKTYFRENEYTKDDIYEHFYGGKFNQTEDKSNQYATGKLIFRKSDWSIRFLQQWIEPVSDFHLVSDEASIIPNFPAFEDNRHDQSMISMLLKSKYPQREEAGIKDEFSQLHLF